MTPSSQTAGGRFSRISWLVGTRVTELMPVYGPAVRRGVVRHVPLSSTSGGVGRDVV